MIEFSQREKAMFIIIILTMLSSVTYVIACKVDMELLWNNMKFITVLDFGILGWVLFFISLVVIFNKSKEAFCDMKWKDIRDEINWCFRYPQQWILCLVSTMMLGVLINREYIWSEHLELMSIVFLTFLYSSNEFLKVCRHEEKSKLESE